MDLITDALMHADVAKLKVATRKIAGLAHKSSGELKGTSFQKVSETKKHANVFIAAAATIEKDHSRVPSFGDDQVASDSEPRVAAKKAAMRKLETVLATKMVEGMMPKDQSKLYGAGTAGEIWRGLHIEAMGKALASQGLFATSKNEVDGLDQRSVIPQRTKTIVPFAG